MREEIIIQFVRGKLTDGCKRFDADIVERMIYEYDRAQDEIEKGNKAITENSKLRLEIERLREALGEIATIGRVEYDGVWEMIPTIKSIACAALENTMTTNLLLCGHPESSFVVGRCGIFCKDCANKEYQERYQERRK